MKKVAHKFAFLKNSSYICTVAEGLRRHNWEAFSYSASVNLDNSLNIRIRERRNLRLVYMYYNIYCLRCERLFLFNIQAVESLQMEYAK